MIELNNPLPLVSVKFLGIGIELVYEHYDDAKDKLCLTIEAVAWKYCKVW